MLIRFAVPAFTEERSERSTEQLVAAPATDVLESEQETVVLMEMPGVERSAMKVTFDRGILTVSAERRPLDVPASGRVLMREQSVTGYRRSVRIGHPVEVEAMTAHLEDGLLRISLPKAATARPRVIEVR